MSARLQLSVLITLLLALGFGLAIYKNRVLGVPFLPGEETPFELALEPGVAPRSLAASEVIQGLQPADVCEAVEGVRQGLSRDERTEAVARIVRRRKLNIFRVRDEPAGEDHEAAGGHPARSPRRPG